MTTTAFTNAVTLTDAAWFSDVDAAAYESLTTVAGTNTITGVGSSGISAYAAGQRFRFKPAATNSGATTLNVTCNSVALGAKNVFVYGAACVGGEIVSGVPVEVIYDGTQFSIVGPAIPATQAQQQTGTSNSVVVTPGRMVYHDGVAKAQGVWNNSGTIQRGYNLSSVTVNAAGDYTPNTSVTAAAADWMVAVMIQSQGADTAATTLSSMIHTITTTSARIQTRRPTDGARVDPTIGHGAAFLGRLA